MALVFTPRGWRPLVRMYVPELRQASRELPGADLETVRRRAFELIAAPAGADTPTEARPLAGAKDRLSPAWNLGHDGPE